MARREVDQHPGRDRRPSVVVAGDERAVSALVELFGSWSWPVLATAPDDLAAMALVRRLRPELFVVHGSAAARFGDLELARGYLRSTAIVSVVDVPQHLAADRVAILNSLPADALRQRLEQALDDIGPPTP